MIKIKIQAGLGNQMFQYALARYLKEFSKKEILLDLSFYTKDGVIKGDTVRGYELDKFNIDKSFKISYKATPKVQIYLEKIIRKLFNLSSYVFYRFYKNPIDGSYLIGFWQSEKYFKEIEGILKKEFTLKNKIEDREDGNEAKKHLEYIKESTYSISINIRRGDYANNPNNKNYFGLLDKKYFFDGLHLIKQKLNLNKEDINIFVFSDDINWCKSNLDDMKEFGNLIFIPENIEASDSLYLISNCKSNIVANSSFSWWGAWLNENKEKIVVAPKKWMKAKVNTKDICPDSWIRLENSFTD